MERPPKKEFKSTDTDSAIIADLSRAIEDLVLRHKQPGEGIMIEARQLAREWKVKGCPLFDGSTTKTALLLLALVAALKREHELLEQIRRHLPVELEELQGAVLYAQMREIGEALAGEQSKPTPRQVSEKKRGKWHRSFRNSIEYQYGGALVADLRKYAAPGGLSDKVLQWFGATCLDDVFAGRPVNMHTLEDLFFGIDRKGLGKILRGGKKKRRYDFANVIQIMGKLLKERRRKKRKGSKPGPQRQIWLNDRDLREQVLKGIEARLNSFPVREEIKAALGSVVYDHLQSVGKR